MHFVKFSSKAFSETERRWDTTEREAYAVVWALENNDLYLRGKRVLVYSDHKALTHLDTATSPKLVRWAARIGASFVPGLTNGASNDGLHHGS